MPKLATVLFGSTFLVIFSGFVYSIKGGELAKSLLFMGLIVMTLSLIPFVLLVIRYIIQFFRDSFTFVVGEEANVDHRKRKTVKFARNTNQEKNLWKALFENIKLRLKPDASPKEIVKEIEKIYGKFGIKNTSKAKFRLLSNSLSKSNEQRIFLSLRDFKNKLQKIQIEHSETISFLNKLANKLSGKKSAEEKEIIGLINELNSQIYNNYLLKGNLDEYENFLRITKNKAMNVLKGVKNHKADYESNSSTTGKNQSQSHTQSKGEAQDIKDAELRRSERILGVVSTDTKKDIHAKYLDLVKQYHPDQNNANATNSMAEALEKTKLFNAAWEVIKNNSNYK